MKTLYVILSVAAIALMGVVFFKLNKTPIVVQTPNVSEHYVGNVKLNNEISVRLLVLKHCPDSIADVDASQSIQAANLAKTRGLDIKDIGNHRINEDGVLRGDNLTWGKAFKMNELKSFIKEQSKINAQTGDTLIIYTIGHGGGSGNLMWLGQREILMNILAEVAEETEQETLWWQLSCHAAAGLPKISSLTEKQQEYFSMIASSPANELSYFATQGAQMEKVFLALAEKNKKIDPNQDNVVTAQEFKDFLNQEIKSGRGDLMFASSPDEPIFGWFDFANNMPIINRRTGEKIDLPIPLPERRSP